MTQLLLSVTSPSVTMHNGRPATTSLEITKFFGKRHDNVVRDIETVLSQLPENSLQLNFEESFHEQETPLGVKRVRMFILYRDGFMLLVMGYTGKKAMAMKIAYIEAFNAMEAALAASLLEAATVPMSTVATRKPLEKLVKVWAARSGIPHAQCWTMLDSRFGLVDINDLPLDRVPDAIEWVQARIDALPVAQEQLALPATSAVLEKRAQKVQSLVNDLRDQGNGLRASIYNLETALRFRPAKLDALVPAFARTLERNLPVFGTAISMNVDGLSDLLDIYCGTLASAQ